MRLLSRSSSRHLGAMLLSAIAVSAVLAPVAAIADDGQPPPTAGPAVLEIDPPDDIVVTRAACDDPLAVATTDGIDGDHLAIALTARALEADTPGWSNVGWEAATGTVLRTVFVSRTDGTVTEAGDSTSATDVASLTFCGTAEPPTEEAPPEAATSTSPEPVPATTTNSSAKPAATPAKPAATPGTSRATPGTPPATPEPAPATAEPATATPQTPRTPTKQTTPEFEPDLAAVTVPTPETPAVELTTGATDDGEVEVMGIQLAREEEPGGSSPRGATAALLALALFATADGVLRSRRS